MKIVLLISFLLGSFFSLFAQHDYASSEKNPFGLLNPDAPKQTADYKDLIGDCNCTSQRKNPDGTWGEPIDMIWRWKYIMNGKAVQDETFKPEGTPSGGSIRQFSKDSMRWYVHYYSSNAPIPKLPTWEGNKNREGKIVLYKEQKAPNGLDGFSRLTFFDIDKKGYKWIGEWVDTTETVVFPFWKIVCTRNEE